MSSQQKVKPGNIFGNVKPSQVKPDKFAGLPRPDLEFAEIILCGRRKV
jgi:hypothetical protein